MMSSSHTITDYARLTDKIKNAVQVRINYIEQSPELLKSFAGFVRATRNCSIEEAIRDLVAVRTSQMNGCGFCSEMCFTQAKVHGERELRLFEVAAWRESTLFTARERAALDWAEVLTKLSDNGVSDDIYDRVRSQLSEKEISDLTFVIMAVNSLNRLTIGFKTISAEAPAFAISSTRDEVGDNEPQFEGWPF